MLDKEFNTNDKGLLGLMVGAIGVVYGDIGTSPLYALRSCFSITNLPISPENILGIISLFLWILIIVVYCKYIFIVMRCDHHGEGGVLALSSLCKKTDNDKVKKVATALGLIGLALFVGDSVITPAISVLSACEGLNLVSNIPEHFIILIALVILFLLFFMQSQGSGNIGKYFGYIMLLWFITISGLGFLSILKNPTILHAINPYYAIKFIINNKMIGFSAIGASILVVSGVEALYADMGHFGKKPIKYTWSIFVLPALSLNYLGQGAFLLNSPNAINNIFYRLAPENILYPIIILSLIATVIASQAVISGIFSLTKQAIMLNYIPRMIIKHTSFYYIGQIYVPAINYILFTLTISAVLIFKNSDSLSFAYGLSVASVMLVTTLFSAILAYYRWKWSLIKMIIVFIPFLFLDLIFVSSNLGKILQGAWYTLAIAMLAMYIMSVWIKGTRTLKTQRDSNNARIAPFLKRYLKKHTIRIPGCAVFMTRSNNVVPAALKTHLKHNKYLHEKVIFVSIITEDIPRVPLEEKFNIVRNLTGVFTVQAHFGFYETPNLNKIIEWMESKKILNSNEEISFFLNRDLPVCNSRNYFNKFNEEVYVFLSNNALTAHEFFKVDHNKVIELGTTFKI